MLILEALRAKHGDALLLHSGTAAKPAADGHRRRARRRLQRRPAAAAAGAPRPARRCADGTPLEIALMMVSHIDDDHIAGMLELMRKLRQAQEASEAAAVEDQALLAQLLRRRPRQQRCRARRHRLELRRRRARRLPARRRLGCCWRASAKGRELRDLVNALKLDGNPPFSRARHGRPRAGPGRRPEAHRGGARQGEPDRAADQMGQGDQAQAEERARPADCAEIAAFVDKSVYNLSSIVVLVESQGKRLLLTGDGRGDHTLAGLEAAGLLDGEGRIDVDVLKLPHHGSVRNVEPTTSQPFAPTTT